ncbi:MAG: hypothetical protein CO013_11330 [Syntrophobacterales bacterium CG_4_8_14_3_um_filter_58_8]|nr:MAG: hypothetical protein AUK26_14250 [Syntrophaceae bacterium CG2_30_58_14]PIV06324.1 MAG: hypothetical protein COS57_04015 [Syntrophobacterales bacterium CG03_land_8_20_14_0_80_58_14]PJC72049.1 MAG: hypothetical protein CO013_11330 [Syntrophobacterales bacterium CG_4_8_14_3_um_filter_58_8]
MTPGFGPISAGFFYWIVCGIDRFPHWRFFAFAKQPWESHRLSFLFPLKRYIASVDLKMDAQARL